MKKYEYQTLQARSPEVNERELNEMGERGWLLVQVYQHPRHENWVYIFAREIIDDRDFQRGR